MRLDWASRFRIRILRACLLMFVCCAVRVIAAESSLEYNVKAAFLFNFTRFVEWPESVLPPGDGPFNICLVGQDHVGAALEQIVRGELVAGHRIAVERTMRLSEKSCQLAYFEQQTPESELSRPPQGVLTVGDGSDFLRHGIIAFVIDDGHVRFEINLRTATGVGLKISSRMLAVARAVEK